MNPCEAVLETTRHNLRSPLHGAVERTRTSTSLRTPAPQAGVSPIPPQPRNGTPGGSRTLTSEDTGFWDRRVYLFVSATGARWRRRRDLNPQGSLWLLPGFQPGPVPVWATPPSGGGRSRTFSPRRERVYSPPRFTVPATPPDCSRGDSNPHVRRHRGLSPARLPFRHESVLTTMQTSDAKEPETTKPPAGSPEGASCGAIT